MKDTMLYTGGAIERDIMEVVSVEEVVSESYAGCRGLAREARRDFQWLNAVAADSRSRSASCRFVSEFDQVRNQHCSLL